MAAQGFTIVAVSDSSGAIHNAAGLDVDRLIAHKKSTGSVGGYPGATAITAGEVLEVPCDVLVPAALENQITGENAGRIQARLVLEAANGPITPDADSLLEQRGVTVVPDVLANAGGVTVSYFEWVQDLQSFFWDEDEINARLEKVMHRAFAEVWDTSKQHGVSLRTRRVLPGHRARCRGDDRPRHLSVMCNVALPATLPVHGWLCGLRIDAV